MSEISLSCHIDRIFQMKWPVVHIIFRNSEKWQRSQLDLCVVVFRTRSAAQPQVGRLVEHSKRQVRGFVGCHKMLEEDHYILVCLAFNHWHTGSLILISQIINLSASTGNSSLITHDTFVLYRHGRPCVLPRLCPSNPQLKKDFGGANYPSIFCASRCDYQPDSGKGTEARGEILSPQHFFTASILF